MYVSVFDSDGIPLKRERWSRAQHEVDHGRAEWVTVEETAQRLYNMATVKAAHGESVAADAYYNYATTIRADSDTGASQDKVLWLFRPVCIQARKKGLGAAERRMAMRRNVGIALGQVWDGSPESLAWKGAEYMFSAAGRNIGESQR